MNGRVVPLNPNEQDKWSRALLKAEVNKVGFVYTEPGVEKNFLQDLLLACPGNNPYKKSLITYTGFGFMPTGVLLRNAENKDFHYQRFTSKAVCFYVAQAFEKSLSAFRFGMPVVLLEGVLDVESFVYLTGYPYAMGYMTSYVGSYLAGLVASITDKVILVPDNDKSGMENTKLSMNHFRHFPVTVRTHYTVSKDFGDIMVSPNADEVNMARNFVKAMYA